MTKINIIKEASTKLQRMFVGWGVSFLIGDDLLFDTFSNGEVLKKNFEKFRVEIKKLRHIVISHEHWDHYGGLWYILEEVPNVKVYVCSSFSEQFKLKIKNFKTEVIEVKDFLEIKPNIFTTGEIIGEYKGESLSEQSLVIRNKKLSIITGCSHPGVINIIKKVKQKFAQDNIGFVLGGFHLIDKNEKEIEKIVLEFKSLNIEKVAPCHCSGEYAKKIFKKEFKENFIEIVDGVSISL